MRLSRRLHEVKSSYTFPRDSRTRRFDVEGNDATINYHIWRAIWLYGTRLESSVWRVTVIVFPIHSISEQTEQIQPNGISYGLN